ncbi:carbonic anhydrase [Rothia aeria]|uniref:carbonic anhydrase n=1 Tax=Rothia aeria TaxID=172042 RepID=UPI00242A8A50|nr:carbonic anhydrase [Rothia aeria]
MTRKLTALTATLALLATGCSASTDNTAPTGSPSTPSTTTAPAPSTATQTPTVTEVNPTTATPTVSLDPSPLAGAGGGPQQPSSVPTLNTITDEDRARAIDAAKAIVTAYTSGKPYKEWSADLFPLIDAELQNQYNQNLRVDLLKGNVTSAELVDDPTLKIPGGDNPYWLTVHVKVDGGISPAYYVRLHRTAERPNKWKASHILEPQAYNTFVNSKTKNKN